MSDLDAAKKAIIDAMEKQFDDLTDEGEAVLGEVAEKYKKLATGDLTSGVNDATDEAIDKLNAKLDDATNKAKDELQAAIDRAKKDITKELKEQTKSNTKFMKDVIDKHIRSIELNINNLAINLKKESLAAIGQAANAKVDAAKKSLDDIVSGIK